MYKKIRTTTAITLFISFVSIYSMENKKDSIPEPFLSIPLGTIENGKATALGHWEIGESDLAKRRRETKKTHTSSQYQEESPTSTMTPKLRPPKEFFDIEEFVQKTLICNFSQEILIINIETEIHQCSERILIPGKKFKLADSSNETVEISFKLTNKCLLGTLVLNKPHSIGKIIIMENEQGFLSFHPISDF